MYIYVVMYIYQDAHMNQDIGHQPWPPAWAKKTCI